MILFKTYFLLGLRPVASMARGMMFGLNFLPQRRAWRDSNMSFRLRRFYWEK
jgi:hypothetical protein